MPSKTKYDEKLLNKKERIKLAKEIVRSSFKYRCSVYKQPDVPREVIEAIDKVYTAVSKWIDSLEVICKEAAISVETNDECIVCGKKGSAVLCDSCAQEYKEKNKDVKS